MKVKKATLLAEVHRFHEELNRVKEVVKALPDDLPDHHIHVGRWAVYIDLPYDWEVYKSVRRAFGGNWHSSGVHTNDATGQKFFVLRLGGEYGKDLYITLEPTHVGSNCHLEKVGERSTDLFRVVCE